jgi:hypothetical protein
VQRSIGPSADVHLAPVQNRAGKHEPETGKTMVFVRRATLTELPVGR